MPDRGLEVEQADVKEGDCSMDMVEEDRTAHLAPPYIQRMAGIRMQQMGGYFMPTMPTMPTTTHFCIFKTELPSHRTKYGLIDHLIHLEPNVILSV